jgi:PHD/YefM family antitoxin component YafN of YafNO toxin-antitoxin module
MNKDLTRKCYNTNKPDLPDCQECQMERKTKQFVVTEKGQKTGILLSLKEYESLIEDLHDLAVIAERKDEPSEPLSFVKEKLLRQWNTESK